jgi:hypothetical protein
MRRKLFFMKSMPFSGKTDRSMKNPIFCLPLIVGLFLMGLSGRALGENYIEVLDKGTVDWTNGFIEAVGVGKPPPNPLNAAHSRAVAERNADLAARNNLIEVVKSIRVDSKTQVGDYLGGRQISKDALEILLRGARSVDLSYEQDEEVRVTVSVRLEGALSDLILPKSILTISTVKQPQEPERKEECFTGLIVDCRGVSLQPAMVPLIVDEEGEVVYGPAFASRDYAAEKGMVSYTRNFASAKNHPRVAPRPLGVKGIHTPKGRPCDIMISQADAAKIRRLASNLGFLHQCRVLVVVD